MNKIIDNKNIIIKEEKEIKIVLEELVNLIKIITIDEKDIINNSYLDKTADEESIENHIKVLF